MVRQVVFIMVDTQSKFMLDCYDEKYGYPLKNLAELAQNSTRFTSAYCVTPLLDLQEALFLQVDILLIMA